TNNQTTATPAPFQQLITIAPSALGSSNFSADLGNIRFYADSAFTQPLYAWVESGNSNTSTATNIWVKLPNGIPANSSITIYMKLEPVGTEYDGVYMGEAPQLSSTYGQYDNGANVFNNYWNFAGTTAPSGWTVNGAKINNGISIPYSSYAYTTTNYGLSSTTIVDFYGNFPLATSTDNAAFGFVEYGAGNAGVCVAWTINTNNNQGETNYAVGQTATGESSGSYTDGVSGGVQATGYHIYSIYWPSTSEAIFSYDYGPGTTFTTNIPTSQYPLGGINTQGSQATPGPFYWLRIRAYPPNGIMPSIQTNLIIISITNNQSSATPAPFQQLITIAPSALGSSNFSADLGNIRFYADSAFTQPLYAWVESGNSNTSTATNIWVKLPNGIPANSSITIYMKLEPVGTEYDGVYMGEAPQLSSTYGQYDNGANVFNNYWNFVGTTLPSNLTYTVLSNPSGASGSYSVNNGLTITNTNGPDFWKNDYTITLIYYNNPITVPFIAQAYLTSLTGNSSDSSWTKLGLLTQNTITATSDSNGEAYMVTTDGNGHQFAYQSGTSYVAPSASTYDSQSITYPIIVSLIAQSSTSIGGFFGSSLNNLTQIGSYVAPTSMASSVYMGVFVLSHNSSGASSTGALNYLLTRAYPPNGVMPNTSIGIYLTPSSQS
ncbi:MAG: hypothetical protein QXJ24_05525, partial [Thermoplasmatales archaeon]